MENNVKGNDTKKTCRVKYYSVEVTVKSCIMMWEQRKLEGKKQEGRKGENIFSEPVFSFAKPHVLSVYKILVIVEVEMVIIVFYHFIKDRSNANFEAIIVQYPILFILQSMID